MTERVILKNFIIYRGESIGVGVYGKISSHSSLKLVQLNPQT